MFRFSSVSRFLYGGTRSQSKVRISCHARINPPLCPVQSCMAEVVSPTRCLGTLPEQAHLHIKSLTDHTAYDLQEN